MPVVPRFPLPVQPQSKKMKLQHIAEGLESNRKLLTEENQKDLDNAQKKWIE